MTAFRRFVSVGLLLFTAGLFSSSWVGCGGGGDGGEVTVMGEITGVTRGSAGEENGEGGNEEENGQGGEEEQEEARSGAGSLHVRFLGLFLGTATAQNSCEAETVLACARTWTPAPPPEEGFEDPEGSEDPGAGEQPETRESCRPVETSSCTFETGIRLAELGDAFELFFCDDVNRSGRCADDEPKAFLFRDFGEICNGDRVQLSGVHLDFANGEATAEVLEASVPSACPPPPTPTPLPPCPVAGDSCDLGDPTNPCAPDHCSDDEGLVCRSDPDDSDCPEVGICGHKGGFGDPCCSLGDCEAGLLCAGGSCVP